VKAISRQLSSPKLTSNDSFHECPECSSNFFRHLDAVSVFVVNLDDWRISLHLPHLRLEIVEVSEPRRWAEAPPQRLDSAGSVNGSFSFRVTPITDNLVRQRSESFELSMDFVGRRRKL